VRLRTIARVAVAVALVAIALCTYPGADLVALRTWATPPLTSTPPPAAQGSLAWLHVEHASGRTPFVADPQGRMVLLHGAVPAGLVDYWSGADHSNTNPAPFYPIDPAAYDGTCPSNSSLIATPPLCQADVRQMAAFGFNSIRLPVSWSLLEPSRGHFSQLYLDRIGQVVDWARAAGMYVIISMHQDAFSRYVGRSNPPSLPGASATDLWYDDGAPAWATFTDGFPSAVFASQREVNPAVLEAASNFWYNRAGIQDEYIQTVAFVARRFRDDSTVAGYGLYNEPWPGWNLPPGFEDLLLFPFYRRVVDAITGAQDGLPCPTEVFMPAPCGYPDLGVRDRNHLVFLDTGLLREVTDFPTHLSLPLSSYPNLVLGLHAYTHGYTFDALAKVPPDKATYPWGGYDQTYDFAEREARAIGAALMVTEFGNDPKLDSVILLNELREQELHRVGFAFWTWMDNCGTGWGMADGIDCSAAKSSTPQPSSGCFRLAREQLLARVYPSATGDPGVTYHFDAATGAFRLQAAGRFGDLPTVVVIPPQVTGPVSVSGAVAGEPAISVSGGVRMVTVFPAGGAFSIEVGAAAPALEQCPSSPQ
jgi:hypothetical protein